MTISTKKHLNKKEISDLRELFYSVNWVTTGSCNDRFIKSFVKNSDILFFVKDNDDRIIGFTRCLTDKCWQANIDCLIVHEDCQKLGYGTVLMEHMMYALKNVKFINICTNDPKTKGFYKRFRFNDVDGLYLQRENL